MAQKRGRPRGSSSFGHHEHGADQIANRKSGSSADTPVSTRSAFGFVTTSRRVIEVSEAWVAGPPGPWVAVRVGEGDVVGVGV